MGGHRQPRTSRRDSHHVYRALCIDLADTLGYSPEEVFGFWSQVALAREWAGEPRDFAEEMAMNNIRFALDRAGAEPD